MTTMTTCKYCPRQFHGAPGTPPQCDYYIPTRRERDILALLARGLTNKQIGQELHISTATAENHIRNIAKKLGLPNRTQVARYAWEHSIGTER
jgi:DNA-binding NarL/FixJ family response regulator